MSLDPQREQEIRKRQRSRAVMMAIGLLAFALLIYFITIVRMTG
jgi:hypothetical protein